MNRKNWKGAAFIAMLAALAMCLSACSFIDNVKNNVDWESVMESAQASLEASSEAPEVTEEPKATVAPDVTVIEGELPEEDTTCAYERYQNMSADAQQKYVESFDSVEAFFAWLNRAQAEHEAHSDAIEIGNNTVIDMSGLAE